MHIRRFAAVVVALTATAAEAAPPFRAQSLVYGAQPQYVLLTARAYGEADLDVDPLGDPVIRGKIEDLGYFIYFYGCSEGKACTNLMFSARWESDHYNDKSMGDWNRERRFGKAFLDEDGNPAVEMNVNLFGGVSRDNLVDTFDWWRLVLTDFADYYGF